MNPEQAKFLADYFANLIENEGRTTVKVLEAVPERARGYRPDEKSRSAWELATHLVLGEFWFLDSIIAGRFVFDPEAEARAADTFTSVSGLIDHYRAEFPQRITQLRGLSGERLTRVVDFFGMFQWPAASFLGLANNHTIHHRGQLASYLRAMGSRVPSIYGGSADQPMTGAAG